MNQILKNDNVLSKTIIILNKKQKCKVILAQEGNYYIIHNASLILNYYIMIQNNRIVINSSYN